VFGLSFTEVVIIAVLALILLGPDNLPGAARTIGKGLREFRKATEDIKDQIETEIYSDELKKRQPAVAPVPAAKDPKEPATNEPAAAAKDPAALPTPVSVPEYLPGLSAQKDPPAPVEPAPAPARPDEPGEPPRS
jgi:sec-independent protein translocase protein TatB